MLVRAWLLLLVAASGLGACAESRVCAPGSTQHCFCTDGAQGAQSCADDGARWEACACSTSLPLHAGAQVLALAPPAAASVDRPKSDAQAMFGVELHANGDILVYDKRLPDDESVFQVAKEALAKDKDLRAVIRADTAVQHGRVMRVLDLMKQAGITKIAFGVRAVPPELPGGPPAAP